MLLPSPLFLLSYLLATGPNADRATGSGGRGRGGNLTQRAKRGRGGGGRGRGGRGAADGYGRSSGRSLGRKRYTREGTKKKSNNSVDDLETRQEELSPLPPLTVPNGPRPFYFTCRHTYEHTLIDEINRYAKRNGGEVHAMSPYPGLVRVEDNDGILPTFYDPVYALQSMPQSVVVTAESIKSISKQVINALLGVGSNDDDDNDESKVDRISQQQHNRLRSAERGSLSIHCLVPGMCKAQTKPVMQHRSDKIGEEIAKMTKKMFPAARKAATEEDPSTRWLLQVMLQSPNIAVASLVECQKKGPGQNAYWPNYVHPLGLAKVDIVEKMPSSAYRKLMEGIECMKIAPKPKLTTVVDLGACPGGWTSVMRRLGCYVVAVDRSELDAVLMRDDMVEFIKGDAFTFEPKMAGINKEQDCWMISDVIAYPERCTELLQRWCEGRWASNMIVTMKFQGGEPDLDELDNAIKVVQRLGYNCRVKHFFNNKNEVTFMVSEKDGNPLDLEVGSLGSTMFPVTL
eukprot:scaffold42321_cov161-Skeletonema_dohrnii-CCMP3373.AAC.2